jgi:dephospho-CoA kinase
VTVVALTGGIASGKTTVTESLTAEGLRVVDADVLAREAVEPGSPGLEAIIAAFGPSILGADRALDRNALAALIFEDPGARERLNAIVHPEVHRLSTEQFAQHRREHPDTPLVYAVPLLVESGRVDEFDAVVVVHAPREQRIARLVSDRGLSHQEAVQRVDAQASDAERETVADCLLDASISPDHTREGARVLAKALWEHWPDVGSLPKRLP